MENNANIERYILEGYIGKGKEHNRVWLARDVETTQLVALKESELPDNPLLRRKYLDASKREFSILQSTCHKNIIAVVGWCQRKVQTSKTTTKEVTYTIEELAPNGDLFFLLQYTGRLSVPYAREYGIQLLNAVSYLHSNQIFHRDLKPENILLDTQFRLKLCDFDWSIKLEPGEICRSRKDRAGTQRYMPPEMWGASDLQGVLHTPYDPVQAEIFTFGVLLFTMAVGLYPFNVATSSDPMYCLFCTNGREYWGIWKQRFPGHCNPITEDFIDLINSLLAVDPAVRISLQEVYDHKWFRGEVPDERTLYIEMYKRRQYAYAKRSSLQLQTNNANNIANNISKESPIANIEQVRDISTSSTICKGEIINLVDKIVDQQHCCKGNGTQHFKYERNYPPASEL